MKLEDLFEEKKPGTYAGVKFSDSTLDALVKFIDDNDIKNSTAREKLHCTLLYSRKHCPDFKARGKIDPPLIGTFDRFEIWKTQPKEGQDRKHCLVLKFKCPELVKRHKELMDEHDATYDFPEYKTHITLSYDVGPEFEVGDLPKFNKKIEIVNEYQEDLDNDWADKSKKND